jgi:hypothetical protein
MATHTSPSVVCVRRPARAATLMLALAAATAVFGCHRDAASPGEIPGAAGGEAREPEAGATASDEWTEPSGAPPRWVIDGTTMAADPRLPRALARALREHGRANEEVQDHILSDLNGDGILDAVLLLPAPAVSGAYDHLVLVSDGNEVRVHTLAALVPGASFSVAVVPLVDGPTLVAVAPRLGGCERGPQWSFVRATGGMLESVGSVRVDDYDCAEFEHEASVEFEREADGRVTAVVVRRGPTTTRHHWDPSVGSFVAESR